MNQDPEVTRDAAGGDAYRELFERSADAILIIEGETFIDCNDAAVRMLRCKTQDDVLRTHPSELSPPAQPDGRNSFEKANEMIAIAFEQGSHRFEWDHLRGDGEVFPVEVLLTSVQEPGRRVLHVVWRDITERKALEEQLRHALKMEAIGKLAGGIAHDFNNLLVVVQGHADLLARRLNGEPDALVHVDQIKTAGDKATQLVEQLLAFGRKQQSIPRVLDLQRVVRDATSLLKPLLGDAVELVVTASEEHLVVKVDEGQIEQVLLNLASNARDAMPRGGRVTIDTRPVQLTEKLATTSLAPGNYGLLTVTDTGTGMSAETARRAFDPFFTTKQIGEGTGLGLASVYGIVSQCGGEIVLRSELGVGTIVEIHLPLTRELPASRVAAPSEAPAGGGTETILVVEDDPNVSQLVVSVLSADGYGVQVAANGLEAVGLYLRHAATIKLVLTDVMMPQMNGVEMVAELTRLGFEPAVLFMSGYTNNALLRLAGIQQDIDLIRKPFNLSELSRRVRQALDQAENR